MLLFCCVKIAATHAYSLTCALGNHSLFIFTM